MPRPDTDASDRLQHAALELFAERGFKATTVPEIAQRAGLTTRSFFRHYADKREVLFAGEEEVPARIAGLMASRPPGLSLSDLILWGVQTIAREHIAPQRDYLLARRAIIQDDPGLRERDLRKQDDMALTLAAALEAQGVDATTAIVVAKITNAVSTTAVEGWLNGPEEKPLAAYIDEAHGAFRGAAAAAEDPFGPTSALPPLVRRAADAAAALGFDLSCRPAHGRLLAVLAGGVGGGLIGETGTGCGVGLAWLASGAAPDARLISVELDGHRAAAARDVFREDRRVTIVEADWSTLRAHGPFDLLSLDGGGQGKRADDMIDPGEWLHPGGTLVMDDFVPADAWPPRYGGELDRARLGWLEHPLLLGSELRTEPDQAAIVATLRHP